MKNVITFTIVLISVFFLTSTVSYSQNFWQAGASLGASVNELAINSSGDLFAATNGKGIFRSTDEGTTWTRIDTISGMQKYYYSIFVDKSNNLFVGSFLGQAYRSTDNGATWTKFYLGDSSALVTAFAADNHGKIYAGTCGSGLFTSTTSGATWDTLEAPDYPEYPINPYVTSIQVDSRGNVFVGTYGGGLWRSTDDGDSWSKDGAEYWRVNTFAASANNRIFIGTDIGLYYDTLRVDTTRDTLGVVVRIDTVRSGWAESGFHIDRIDTLTYALSDTIIIPEDPPRDSVYTRDTTVYDTTIYHNQWYVLSLAATSGGHIYAGMVGRGVYQSTDNGTNWLPWSTGIVETTVTALLINPASGYLYAATTTGAFYKSINPDPTVLPGETSQPITIPKLAELEQNYPNPFNPTTNIPFTLRENSYTTLVIYDMLGKEVARLVDGMVTAGRHDIRWDASSVSSGVYFYRLQTPSVVTTGKLTLIR
jgi:photosystem II stability/assembly factor-like uncharacterized protein